MKNKNTTSYTTLHIEPKLSDPALWGRIRDWHQSLSADTALTARIRASGALRGEDASPLLLEYLRFAYLAWTMPDGATPSKAVDEAWHAHLLFTRSYDRFCLATRGERLHHDPGDGEGDAARFEAAYRATIARYEAEFGPAPERWWPRPAAPAPAPKAAPEPRGGNVALKVALMFFPLWGGGLAALLTGNPAAGIMLGLISAVVGLLAFGAAEDAAAQARNPRRGATRGRDGGSSSGSSCGGLAAMGDAACADGGAGGCGDGGGGGDGGASCGGGGCGGGGCGGG